MKKALLTIFLIAVVLGVSSCKRAEIVDPPWDGPAGFNILLEGSISPALLVIDGKTHISKVSVLVTDSKGNPLAGKTIHLAQFDSVSSQQVSWGYFDNRAATIEKVTDANGEISATYYWPLEWLASAMYIHAVLIVDGRSYSDSLPQDYMSLTLVRANDQENEAPVVNIVSPPNNAVVSGTVAISVLASDADNGINMVECYIDGQLIDSLAGSDTSNDYSFSWDASLYVNGRHTIRVTAFDKNGKSASDSVSVTLNNSDAKPTVAIVYPVSTTTIDLSAVTNKFVTIKVNATDDRGISRIQLYINEILQTPNVGKKSGTLYEYKWSTTSKPTPIVAGTNSYTLYVIAYDTLNQMTKSASVTVTVTL